jgi:hypothetical protein
MIKAFNFWKGHLNLVLSINSPSVLILVLNELGKINANTDHVAEAFQNYDEVLKLVEEVDEPGIEAEALFHRGSLFAKQGRF